jgi:hypothetical protein
MNPAAPGVLVCTLAVFTFLFRRESCPRRRRQWCQVIAISGLLPIATIAGAFVFGARAGDCGFELAPDARAQNR